MTSDEDGCGLLHSLSSRGFGIELWAWFPRRARRRRARQKCVPGGVQPYPVGRTVFDWVDASRADGLAPTPGVKRELLVWLWYPAASAAQRATAEYLPAAWRNASEWWEYGLRTPASYWID